MLPQWQAHLRVQQERLRLEISGAPEAAEALAS